MQNQNAKIDDNRERSLLGVTDDVNAEIRRLLVDESTGRLKGVCSNCWWRGGGDVNGPGSSTDNAIARFDGTTGKLLQNSGATISDTWHYKYS